MTNNYDPHTDGFLYDEIIEIPDDIFDDINPSPAAGNAGNNGDFIPVTDSNADFETFDPEFEIFEPEKDINPFDDVDPPTVSTFSTMLDNKPHAAKPDSKEMSCIKARLFTVWRRNAPCR